MPLDQTQPSKPSRRPEVDPLAETDRRVTDSARTQPNRVAGTRQTRPPANPRQAPKKGMPPKRKRILHLFLALVVFFGGLILLGGISWGIGFGTGQSDTSTQETLEMEVYLMSQYQQAVEDFQAGNILLARDRLVYIVQKERDFDAAIDLLVQVQLTMNLTATPPAPTATVTLTPTPDMRPAEEQYNNAVVLITQRAWDLALETLSNLRKVHPDYRIIDVDGLMYLALRNRGIEKILNGELEGGIYDFARAEKFGPLDNEANNYRTWARLYLLGNAFWGAYPEQAAYYYGQVVGAGVDIRDASGVSAFYRYWASLAQMGDFSAEEGAWCLASEQYQVAINSWARDELIPTATYAWERCFALTPSATATLTITNTFVPQTGTPTPSATLPPSGDTATPTFTFTPTYTPGGAVDTDTPTPTSTPAPTSTFTPTPTDTEAAP